MLRTVFAVTLCILALQCYTTAALAPHLECDAFWDAITYCGGSSSVAVWERRWCERCCEGLSAQDTGFASDIFSEGSSSNVVSDSRSLRLAMLRASTLTAGSDQQIQDRSDTLGPNTCRTSGASCTGTQACCSGLVNVGGQCQSDAFGPNTCRTSGASVTGTQLCCSGLVKLDGYCQDSKRSVDSTMAKRTSAVTGNELCHHFWSRRGPDAYEGDCFIRRLSTHLPTSYTIYNAGGLDLCAGVPVAVPDSLTFGNPVPDRSISGSYPIDKCQSNMNYCHCCAKKKSSPLFGSWEQAAGPGLSMDQFSGLDGGDDDTFLAGPSTCRSSGASVTGTQTCCSGSANLNGICVNDTTGPSTCRTSGATATGTQTCCSGLVNISGVCTAE